MASFRNVNIYIKRTELHDTKEYIIQALRDNGYGKVSDITFIPKKNEYGQDYNGAIVVMEMWYNTELVKKMFEDFQTLDRMSKVVHNFRPYRYWIVQEYKQQVATVKNTCFVEPSLPDSQKVIYLENLLHSLSVQMNHFQTITEKSEQQIMDYECQQVRSSLINAELRYELNEKTMEKSNEKDKQIHELTMKLWKTSVDLLKKQEECEELKQELEDEKSISNYWREQLSELN